MSQKPEVTHFVLVTLDHSALQRDQSLKMLQKCYFGCERTGQIRMILCLFGASQVSEHVQMLHTVLSDLAVSLSRLWHIIYRKAYGGKEDSIACPTVSVFPSLD